MPTVSGSTFTGWQSRNQEKVASFAAFFPCSGVSVRHPPPHNSFCWQSDSSYDFLSAEEKECLLFLEKTIGSLEAEADSGLSTDESEPATSPPSLRAPPTTQRAPQGKRLPREATLRRPGSPKHFPPCLSSAASSQAGVLYSPSQTKAREEAP